MEKQDEEQGGMYILVIKIMGCLEGNESMKSVLLNIFVKRISVSYTPLEGHIALKTYRLIMEVLL
jgi:hypothetical protein